VDVVNHVISSGVVGKALSLSPVYTSLNFDVHFVKERWAFNYFLSILRFLLGLVRKLCYPQEHLESEGGGEYLKRGW
jgi:hypothetical protein